MEENNRTAFVGEDENAIRLADVWHLVWDHKWWYVACVALCICVAAFKIYRSPSIYSRTAKVIIDEGAQEAAMRDLSSFTGSMSRMRYSTNVDNEVEAFASPDLMEMVAERLGLLTSYYEHQFLRTVELGPDTPIELVLAGENPASSFSFDVTRTGNESYELHDFKVGGKDSRELAAARVAGNLRDTISTPVGFICLDPTLNVSSWSRDISVSWHNAKATGQRLAHNVDVSISGKQTSVVVLSINDKFPARAEAMLNSLIDVYNESWIMNKNRSARNTTAFINDRLIVIENELGEIESELQKYKEKNNLTDIKAVSNSYLSASSDYASKEFEVNNQLSIATYLKDYLNDPANTLSMIPSNSGLTSSNVESQIASYNELILRRDNLLANSNESNPLVVDINSSLTSIKTSILRSIDNLIATLKIQADQIKSQEQLVMSRISASTGQEFELISIERQRKVKESLYVFLLQKREENELSSLMTASNTRLIMESAGGNAPVAPRRMVILLIALVCGCGIPFAFFYLRKVMNNTVETKEDVTDSLTMPFLAEIPQTGKKKRLRLPDFKRKDDEKRPIVVKGGKRNVINEAFRVLRTNVDLMMGANKGCKVIMATSMYPGSGKTFISMNLAASMAIKGSRTLMLDLDLRKASMSTSLDAHGAGVAAYLNGTVDDLASCITHVSDNLDLLQVGTLPPNPSELLLVERFATMVESLRKMYDYIFIDCPPAEVVADAAIVSSHVDMTVFIVRSGLMDKSNLPVVESLYKSGKFTRMAVILNGIDTQSHYGHYGHYGNYGGYGYGKGYGYGYAYGNDDEE